MILIIIYWPNWPISFSLNVCLCFVWRIGGGGLSALEPPSLGYATGSSLSLFVLDGSSKLLFCLYQIWAGEKDADSVRASACWAADRVGPISPQPQLWNSRYCEFTIYIHNVLLTICTQLVRPFGECRIVGGPTSRYYRAVMLILGLGLGLGTVAFALALEIWPWPKNQGHCQSLVGLQNSPSW